MLFIFQLYFFHTATGNSSFQSMYNAFRWNHYHIETRWHLTLKIKNVKVMIKVKPIGHIWGLEFNWYVCFPFHGNRTTFGWPWKLLFASGQSHHFWLRYIKFHIWPRKFKVMAMAKVKPGGPIWGLEINRCVCFSFRGNHTIFGWDISNSIFDLKNSRSRLWPWWNPMVTFEA